MMMKKSVKNENREDLKGLVFNIQRYSVHDGSGVRTIIFFKGCALNCPWCSNPESRLAVRPTMWVKNGKTETIGEWYTSEELIKEVLKDEIFYRTSGGGVTLSGGEILMQYEFVAHLAERLQYLGIHTALETTGAFDRERLGLILPFVDQVLFDLKIMDPYESKNVIGADISIVKDNFEMALGESNNGNIDLTPRIPLIPMYTATDENIQSIIEYLLEIQVDKVHLLPFHQYGSTKYEYLGWDYTMRNVATLSEERVAEIELMFNNHDIITIVDGLE